IRQGASLHSMPRWSRAAVLLAMTALAGVPSSHVSAEDSILTWIVKQVREDDNIIQASAMQVPQEGAGLMTGDQISTGSGQHVVLDNGRDLVEVGPNTTISVGDNDPSTAEANVDVVSGAIHVEVGKRKPG